MNEELTGLALDAEVAGKVMGWRIVQPGETDGYAPGYWTQKPPGEVNPTGWASPPPYSTSILYAWKVIERMQELGWHARLTTPFEAGQPWFCGFTPLSCSGWNGRPDHQEGAETMPLAICRVALKALASDGVPTTKWGD